MSPSPSPSPSSSLPPSSHPAPTYTNTGSSSSSGAFHSYPQKFARTRNRASKLASAILEMQRHGPRSEVGIVVDTTFHLTQGYVTCQTNRGVVQVFSVPYGTVVPQMRIFCRRIGAQSTNHAFVFDGYAPNLSALGASGSLLMTLPNLTTASVCTSVAGAVTSISGLSGSTGYYWHLFCFLPSLVLAPVTLFEMAQSGGTNVLTLDYVPGGFLRFHSQDGHGYITSVPVSAHNVHWIQIQPGLVGGYELLVDGQANYVGLLAQPDEPTFTGSPETYTLSLLSNTDGTQTAPVAAWVSKFGFGASSNGTNVLQLSTGFTMPVFDTAIPLLTGTGTSQQQTVVLYMCEDTPGGTTIASSGNVAATLTVATSAASIIATGPY